MAELSQEASLLCRAEALVVQARKPCRFAVKGGDETKVAKHGENSGKSQS